MVKHNELPRSAFALLMASLQKWSVHESPRCRASVLRRMFRTNLLKFSATRGNRSIFQNLKKIENHGIIWGKMSVLTVLIFLFGFSFYRVFLGQVDEAKTCPCCRE